MDKNLQDDWLCRLNQLEYLELRNICEGHLGASGFSQQAHATIKLSVADRITLTGHAIDTVKLFGSSFFVAPYTTVDIHEDEVQGVALSAWIDYTRPRATVEMDDATRSWFTRTVAAAERFDAFIGVVLHEAMA